MKNTVKLAAATILGAAALAFMATDASAAIACNAYGECWHVHHPWKYPTTAGVVIHPEGWKWGPGEKVVWKEHVGRGYWKNGVWIAF